MAAHSTEHGAEIRADIEDELRSGFPKIFTPLFRDVAVTLANALLRLDNADLALFECWDGMNEDPYNVFCEACPPPPESAEEYARRCREFDNATPVLCIPQPPDSRNPRFTKLRAVIQGATHAASAGRCAVEWSDDDETAFIVTTA